MERGREWLGWLTPVAPRWCFQLKLLVCH
jgi:hypothetical protein